MSCAPEDLVGVFHALLFTGCDWGPLTISAERCPPVAAELSAGSSFSHLLWPHRGLRRRFLSWGRDGPTWITGAPRGFQPLPTLFSNLGLTRCVLLTLGLSHKLPVLTALPFSAFPSKSPQRDHPLFQKSDCSWAGSPGDYLLICAHISPGIQPVCLGRSHFHPASWVSC